MCLFFTVQGKPKVAVNSLYAYLEKRFPKLALSWLSRLGLNRNAQQGQQFNGNSCRLLFKRVPILDFLARSTITVSEDLKKCRLIIVAFEQLNEVVVACFEKKTFQLRVNDCSIFDLRLMG